MICLYFPARRSSAMMSRMKSDGLSVSVVIVASKAIGERADRQLPGKRVRIFRCHPERSEVESKDSAAVRKINATGFLDFARNDCNQAADGSANHRSLYTRRSRALGRGHARYRSARSPGYFR